MTSTLAPTQECFIIAGVDSHKDIHQVVVLDAVTGVRLADKQFAADLRGYRDLAAWIAVLG